MNPSFPNATKSFKKANPRLFGQPDDKNSVPLIVERPRGIPEGRKMNDTEAKFALRLEEMKRNLEIDGWMYESMRLRLADRTTYSPDFFTFRWVSANVDNPIDAIIPTFIEIKGFRRDDAMVKFKVAREQYPWAEFQMWELKKSEWNRIY